MTTEPTEAEVREILWPTSGRQGWSAYALLDAARNPRIYPLVRDSGLQYTCLYTGKLPQVLLQAAPYLVRLRKDAELTGVILRDGWMDHWGVLVLANATLEELRRHFKRLLRAQDESGKTMIFRFYDPRVLRVFLPTCTGPELATMFGPAGMFVQAGERGESLSFHREGIALRTTIGAAKSA